MGFGYAELRFRLPFGALGSLKMGMGVNAVSGCLAGLSAITHAAAFVFIVIATARRWGRWHGVNRRFADVYGCASGGVDGYGFVDGGLRLKRQVYFGIASEWGFAVCAGGER